MGQRGGIVYDREDMSPRAVRQRHVLLFPFIKS